MADTTMTETANPQLRGAIMQMAFGYMASQALSVAAELKLADTLGLGTKTVDELAAAADADPTSLYRFLRALISIGVLEETDDGAFRLTKMGAVLRTDHPSSATNVIRLFCGELVWRNWGHLIDSVRTGKPVFELLGTEEPFAMMAADPEFSAMFNQAMSEGTRQTTPGVVAAYDFSQFSVVADLGGGDGTLLAAVLASAPGVRGILYDLPTGSEAAPVRLGEAGVADRCSIVPGDFFESVPTGADAYMMKSVLHDWNDERSITILRNCRTAMGETAKAKVVIVEPVVPPRIAPSPEAFGATLIGDLNMLVSTGGRERTEAEFAAILAAADLRLTKVLPVTSTGAYMSVIEAVPA